MTRRLTLTLLAAVLLLRATAFSQIAPADSVVTDTSRVDHSFWSRWNIARMGAATLVAGTLIYGAGVWWVHDYRPFHFWNVPWWVDDNGVDKLGHMYTSYFMFHAMHEMFLWGGHDPDAAFWWASGVAAFHGLAIEIGDGFSDYGFDYRDVTSCWTGLAYGMLQTKVPFFRNFEIKWSLYYPMEHRSFKLNDLYDYHIYWMSFRVEELLPRAAQPYWPGFFQIAFGLGTKENTQRRTYNIALDYNLELLPFEGQDLNLFKKILNMIHLPAPGVRFSNGHPPEWQLLLLN
jgi:hypothetical protein